MAKKTRIRVEKIQNSSEKVLNSAKKFLKLTNQVDWILSKRVCEVFTMFIALAKIPEREGSISPSSFYGQLLDY